MRSAKTGVRSGLSSASRFLQSQHPRPSMTSEVLAPVSSPRSLSSPLLAHPVPGTRVSSLSGSHRVWDAHPCRPRRERSLLLGSPVPFLPPLQVSAQTPLLSTAFLECPLEIFTSLTLHLPVPALFPLLGTWDHPASCLFYLPFYRPSPHNSTSPAGKARISVSFARSPSGLWSSASHMSMLHKYVMNEGTWSSISSQGPGIWRQSPRRAEPGSYAGSSRSW